MPKINVNLDKKAKPQKQNPEGVRWQQPEGAKSRKECRANEVGHKLCDCGRIGCGNGRDFSKGEKDK